MFDYEGVRCRMAESFVVHPDGLRGYADQLERNNGYVGQMRDYLFGPGWHVEGLMGVFSVLGIQQKAEELIYWQGRILSQFNEKLAKTTGALRQTADSYAQTDAKSAAELDKIMPTPK